MKHEVLICSNCKDFWIKLEGVNYCGSCGRGCLEPTHEGNASRAQNFDRAKFRVEVRAYSIEGFCKLRMDSERETSVIKLSDYDDKWAVSSSMCMPSNIDEALIIQKCVNAVFEEYHKIKALKEGF